MKTNYKPQSILYHQPVLVIASYDKEGRADAMVAAWGGIYDTNQIGFMLDHRHQTTENIRAASAFTVSMATVATMAESDYFGCVSEKAAAGKIAHVGFHVVKSEHVEAPVITEYPLTFECKVSKVTQVGEDFHFVGDIVNILVDDSILTEGKIDPMKLAPITFDAVHGKYLPLGEAVGKAWGEGRIFMK